MTESGNPSQPANVNEYASSHIQVLEARESVRRRPGMYIGSTGERGLHHMVYEVVSYAVDEHLAGHADAIDVTITQDGAIRVTDNGRGLPVEVDEATGKSALELELTELSFGSKPHAGGYGVSGGLSGLGLCVVNALSSRLTVEVHRDGQRWTQEYKKGSMVTPLTRNEETSEHGTTIVFLPDADIFETTRFSFATLSERFQELSFLNGGLAVSLTDERPERPVRYQHTDGLRAYVARLNPYPASLHSPAIAFESENEDQTIFVQVAMQWNAWSPGEFRSFANSTRTLDGGTHEAGFRTALTDVVNDYAHRQQQLSADHENITAEAVHEGLTAVVSVRLAHPVFEGSTRTRLGNREADTYVQEVVREHLTDWLDHNRNEAASIIRHILNRSTGGGRC